MIERFEADGTDRTLNPFEETFLNSSKQGKSCAYLESHIQTLRDTGHTGNAKCYFETFRLLKYYDGKLNQRLLEECRPVKVKRMFLFMAEKARHAWFEVLGLNRIGLGCGMRVIAKGGVYDKEVPNHDSGRTEKD